MSEPVSLDKATPRPWRRRYKGNIGNLIEAPTLKQQFAGDDGYRGVATFQSCGDFATAAEEEANFQANGSLIITAVNCHDELVAALVALFQADGFPEGTRWKDFVPDAVVAAAEAALAKARGERVTAADVSPYLRLPIRDRKTIALAIAKNALRRIAASNRGDVSTLAQETLRKIETVVGEG